MRKALMSTTVAVCGMLGAVFAGGAQAGPVAFSVNINAPLGHGVVVGTSVFGGVQPVYVVPRQVVVSPVVIVPVVRFDNRGYRHRHYRNDFRGYRGHGYRY